MASHFVASTCKLDGDAFVSHLSWSKVDSIAAMAVSTIDGNDRETHQILFVNNEGELIANSSISHDYEANAFEWQPNGKVLAIGWADGMVSCWNVDGRSRPTSSFSNSSQHLSGITVLEWAPNGKRLLTGDKKGLVCLWAVDARGTLTPLRQYRKKGEISCAVFCSNIPAVSAAAAAGGAGASGAAGSLGLGRQTIGEARRAEAKSTCPPFFFGTDRGSVIYADDLGFCTDVQQLSSNIDTMLFYEERSRLIIVTRSLLLTQYQVGEDGKVARVMQVKLSVAGDVVEKGLKNVVWASPGLLCMATQEKMVRLLDLAADESYNLSLSALGGLVERSDKVISVAFGALDGYLAVGTQGGVVGIWKYTGPARDVSGSRTSTVATSADDWELHYKTVLPSPVHELTWQGNAGCAAAVTDDGAVILSETAMQSGMCGNLYVVQKSSHEVTVHVGDSKTGHAWVENTGMIIRGIFVGAACFVVWNGKTVRTYTVDLQLLRSSANDPFACSGTAMCIADASHIVEDALFIVEGSLVKITNYNGVVKGTIPFSEGEGLPEHVDLNGQFLGILSNKGVVKFFDVHSPTKPKALGSAGHFEAVSDSSLAATATGGHAASSAGSVSGSKAAADAGKKAASVGVVVKGGKSGAGAAGTSSGGSGDANSSTAVRRISINSTGTRVAVLVDHVEGLLKVHRPHSHLHVFDRNKGAVLSFDFAPQKRCPSNIFWDSADDRMLAVEATKNRTHVAAPAGEDGASSASATVDALRAVVEGEADATAVEVFLFFATTEHGLLMQDSFARKQPYGKMLGIHVPKLYFRDTGLDSASSDAKDGEEKRGEVQATRVYGKVMRDFVGLDDAAIDDSTRQALLDFSFNLTLGKLDEAYRAVKAIDSPAIWENMARMCVKTKRLDVAEVCLGNMGNARGAAAVRASKKQGDSLEAIVGELAIQLGLLDDAARLFREAERWDKLNKLYQLAGFWDKAIKVATTHDRIHLKNTHHFYAKHLESIGEISEAIENYELAGTSTTEVPRMLFHLNRLDDLEDYVQKSEDAPLMKWWAKYLESNERYDKAKKFYAKANDFLSLVRISCFKGDLNRAAEIVAESKDAAAAYHLARQLEIKGDIAEAINFYAQSGCYNHSIRLARSSGLDAELMRFALKSTKSLMLECGDYFEAKGEPDKAIQLFHKGGDLARALELCFRAGQEGSVLGLNKAKAVNSNAAVFDMMNAIVNDLGAETSPDTLQKCAEFLVLHKQFDRAVELLGMAKKYVEAIDMCLKNRVNISEEMVAMLTPPEKPGDSSVAADSEGADGADTAGGQGGGGSGSLQAKTSSGATSAGTGTASIVYMDPVARKEILKDIAKALKIQGSFTLASKLYTQAGDRVRAIKCLVRGGDTKAVIQFASISRNAEIYKLAANYLQQMNWRESVEIMKAIIQFYTKARAFEQLASFYDSCAQVEIDDYRDYEKAIGALREGLKHLSKANTRSAADMASRIEQRIALIERFVQVRRLAQKDPDTMVTICEGLLQEPLLEEAIRAGDCLAMLVEHYHSRGKMREAYECLKDFDRRHIAPGPFVDAAILSTIYKSVGVTPTSQVQAQQQPVQQQPAQQQQRRDPVEDDRGYSAGGPGGGGGNSKSQKQQQQQPPQAQQQQQQRSSQGQQSKGRAPAPADDDDDEIEEDIDDDVPHK